MGFCNGNSGNPIFTENFGTGNTDSKLNPKRTTYNFTNGAPRDGFYKVSSNTDYYGWFVTKDHTPNDKNGRCLIVNANNIPEEFFTIPISDLCENTTYEFTSWLINLFPYYHKVCGFSGNQVANPINVTFEIWDSTNSFIIKQGTTGDIYGSNTPDWKQYGLVFKTAPEQTSVILKMRNNGSSGCGNDLAIDDIVFKTCGDTVIIKDALSNKNNVYIEENKLPFATTLKAIPDLEVFSTHFYQWQKSNDGKNWVSIPNATQSSFSVKNINTIAYYRVLIAEAATNLLNTSCNVISDIYKVNITASKTPKKKPLKVVNPPKSKKQLEVKKPVLKLDAISQKKLAIDTVSVVKPKLLKVGNKVNTSTTKKLVKTKKQVIIVKDGLKIIYHKVWVDGGGGKFVKTEEKIIKKGDANAGEIIEETIYYKAAYGYNSIKRTYSTKGTP